MGKHMTHTAQITAPGGAPVGAVPVDVAIDGMPGDGVEVEGKTMRVEPLRGERLVGIKELRPMIGQPAISTVYRWVAADKFPKPLKIGDNRVAWRMSDIQRWIASKVRITPDDI